MRPAGSPPLGKAGDLPFINDRLDANPGASGRADVFAALVRAASCHARHWPEKMWC
jgi:hypothetical protein